MVNYYTFYVSVMKITHFMTVKFSKKQTLSVFIFPKMLLIYYLCIIYVFSPLHNINY